MDRVSSTNKNNFPVHTTVSGGCVVSELPGGGGRWQQHAAELLRTENKLIKCKSIGSGKSNRVSKVAPNPRAVQKKLGDFPFSRVLHCWNEKPHFSPGLQDTASHYTSLVCNLTEKVWPVYLQHHISKITITSRHLDLNLVNRPTTYHLLKFSVRSDRQHKHLSVIIHKYGGLFIPLAIPNINPSSWFETIIQQHPPSNPVLKQLAHVKDISLIMDSTQTHPNLFANPPIVHFYSIFITFIIHSLQL